MPSLFSSRVFLDHETGRHPESPERLRVLLAEIEKAGWKQRWSEQNCRPASDEELRRVHSLAYQRQLEALHATGGGRLDADTVMGPKSLDVARLAAGTACAAVDRVCTSDDPIALVLCRPPGHHALPDQAMGFCLFNNIAIAAAHARAAHQLDGVLIVDWDVHHGNGTQDIFYDDGQVGFLSIHRHPFYPGTGKAKETGTGAGLGTTWNLPTPIGTTRRAILDHFSRELEVAAEKMKPQLILISAGFDAHAADPIGSLGLETEDFGQFTELTRQIATTHAQGRIVSLLEGGYNPGKLAESVIAHGEALVAVP